MAGGDALALAVGQGVEHAVVGVDGGEAVLGQLVVYQQHYLGHASIVVRPVTHNLDQHKTN